MPWQCLPGWRSRAEGREVECCAGPPVRQRILGQPAVVVESVLAHPRKTKWWLRPLALGRSLNLPRMGGLRHNAVLLLRQQDHIVSMNELRLVDVTQDGFDFRRRLAQD